MRALPIAASGVTNALQRQALTAHNTANIQTPAYQALRANQAEQPAGGVAPLEPTRLTHAGPQIDGEEGSNTDLAEEAVSSNVNLRSLQANAKAFQAADEMLRAVVDMKA